MKKKIFFLLLIATIGVSVNAQEIKKWKIKDLQSYMEQSNGPVILNFWATFCKPCVEEMPYFQSIAAQYQDKGVKLLLISLDLPDYYPTKVQSFLKTNGITAEVIWLNESDADHFCPKIDSSWSGVIPATLFLNNKTGYRRFYQQQLKAAFFEARLRDAIGTE